MSADTTGGHPPAALRTEWIIELQQSYFSATGVQLLATVVIGVLVILAMKFGRRLETLVDHRYGRNVGEASRVIWLLAVVATGVYSLSIVWHVTYFIDIVFRTLAIDRWTAVQQFMTIAIVLVAYLLIRFANRSIDQLQRTSSLTKHQSEVAYHVSDIGIALGTMTLVLTLWGVDLTNIFIGAGAITAIVGLAARETLAAVLAGFILLFSRPFRVGDWIEVKDHSGIVKDVTIFNTKIQTFSDEHVLVPNDIITESDLTNLSRNDQLRVEVEVGIDYETDVHYAREVVVEAVEDLDSIRSSPDPHVIAKRFADSSILLEVRVWIGEPTMRRRWNARTDAIEAIKDAFDREGITIPYPQRVQSARGDGFDVGVPSTDETTAVSVGNE
ncbi:mechanosensitive ion channel family protein [Halalkalicoccus jeotgali]|uniref:Mechanosensitive ion channel MscS n=1 Tax=Halalkalicoccus jeotgali (strain DSM 18796 / CECT 7217 / JCM 14584 / KCTC 4019 / B3) TaxID=795797 RepID=D8J3C3_HALJB|nr:mechanosensitive ion channel family protein [Halalkalicoccus jeotgali]ADJ15230.1 MscS Mechanosensitive ion channel [Halalkalicoccus jeotgali B3]ELY35193.1 mechanosensitive ion channel MscS [Halalkalicoccus jeotgali B3]